MQTMELTNMLEQKQDYLHIQTLYLHAHADAYLCACIASVSIWMSTRGSSTSLYTAVCACQLKRVSPAGRKPQLLGTGIHSRSAVRQLSECSRKIEGTCLDTDIEASGPVHAESCRPDNCSWRSSSAALCFNMVLGYHYK